MNNYIQIAYLVSSFAAIIAMIPQLRQIIRLKHSKELNMMTWIAWAACQGVSLIYAISIDAKAYALMSVIWIAMYIFMAILIARYKYNIPEYIIDLRDQVLKQVPLDLKKIEPITDHVFVTKEKSKERVDALIRAITKL